MRPFFTAQRRWPPGWTRPHVYLCPDLTVDEGLRDLVDRARRVLADEPVSIVADRWLHATVQRVDGVRCVDLSPGQRDDLAAALRAELATVPAGTLSAGPALAGDSGVVLDVDGDLPGQLWTAIASAVRTAISTTLGAAAVATRPGPPHVSIAYAIGETDSGRLQSRLRREARPARAPLTVAAVELVDVEQDPDAGTYRWQPWARIALS